MLNALREGAKSGIVKFCLFGLMTAAVFGLVLTDVGGFFRGGVPRNTVATIDGDRLTIQEFDQMVRPQLASRGIEPSLAYAMGMIDQLLNREIDNNLLLREASDLGIHISDDELAAQIDRMVAPYVTDGVTKKQAFEALLRSQNMTEYAFVRRLRAEMANAILTTSLALGASAPVSEADDLYRANLEKRTIEVISLPNASITDYQEPTDTILKPFYQSGQERYAIPETRTFTIAILDPKTMREEMAVSDEELESVYAEVKDSLAIPEKRTVEQALLVSEEDAKAVHEAVRGGAKLKDAVKKVTGAETAYTGEQDYDQGGLDKALADAIFAAEKGETITPVQSALGWHVMTVKGVKAGKTPALAEVREQLKNDIIEQRAGEQIYETANAIDDQLAGGADLEQVAKDQSMSLKTYGPVRADGSTADSTDGVKDLGADIATVMDNVFAVEQGEASPVFELSDGRFASVRVNAITEKTYKPLEEVRDELAKLWVADQQETLNKQRTEKLVAALDEKSDLAAVAKEQKLSATTVVVGRSGDAAKPLDTNARTEFFKAEQGEIVVAKTADGYVVGRVNAIEIPDAKPDEDAVAELREKTEGETLKEINDIYLSLLRNKYNVRVNHDFLKTAYTTPPPAAGQ